MNSFIKELKLNLFFIVPYLSFVGSVLLFLLSYNKIEGHILINKYNSPIFDVFFKYITNIGDGLFLTFIAVIFLFIRFRYALILGISGTLSGVFTQTLKRSVFSNCDRPAKIIGEYGYNLNFVDDVKIHYHNSFPSGHSTTVFCLFFCLALFSKNNYFKLIFSIIAIIVAFSRVYLSQHFLIDILVGSFIGLFFSFLTYSYINKFKNNWLDKSFLINLKT